MKKVLVILTLICFIFGTNNYIELNKLAIITNMGINYKNNNYIVNFKEILPNKKYKYYSTKCKNIKKCINDIENINHKNIYLNHLENIIISNKSIIYKLKYIFKDDFDNFNIIITNNPKKIIKYKYISSVIPKNISYRRIKQNILENKRIKIPVVKINNYLKFYKYEELGDNYE